MSDRNLTRFRSKEEPRDDPVANTLCGRCGGRRYERDGPHDGYFQYVECDACAKRPRSKKT